MQAVQGRSMWASENTSLDGTSLCYCCSGTAAVFINTLFILLFIFTIVTNLLGYYYLGHLYTVAAQVQMLYLLTHLFISMLFIVYSD